MQLSLSVTNTALSLFEASGLVLGLFALVMGIVFIFVESGRGRIVAAIVSVVGLTLMVSAVIVAGTQLRDSEHRLEQAVLQTYGVKLTDQQTAALLQQPGGASVLQTQAGPARQYGSTWAEVNGKRTRVTLYAMDGNRWVLGSASSDLHELTKR